MKRELKEIYYDVYQTLSFEPKKILTISKESGVSWESTKNCLEILSHIGYIRKTIPNKEAQYSKKQFIDVDTSLRELLLKGLQGSSNK